MRHLFLIFFVIPLFFGRTAMAQPDVILPPMDVTINGPVDDGYLFLTPGPFSSTGDYPSQMILADAEGSPIFYHYVGAATAPPFQRLPCSDFRIQEDGTMTFVKLNSQGLITYFFLDSTFNYVDSIECGNNYYTDAHEIIQTSFDYYHILCIEERPMDLSGMTTTGGQPGSVNGQIAGFIVQRLDAAQNVVWEWKSLDHYQVSDSYLEYFTNPTTLDHTHTNSLWICADGSYLISSRHLNEVTKFNANTGQIIWQLGGKNNDFTFVGDTTLFTGQHFARELPNGNIILFDNAYFASTPIARGVEYALDTIAMTATLVWEYKHPTGMPSEFIGNAQRLPNGNTIIDWGGTLPLTNVLMASEVDAAGNPVMEIKLPDNYMSYRALKYDVPFELPRPEITCDSTGMMLSAPAGHDSYYWNTGETTQSIALIDTGTYSVWVDQGIGMMKSYDVVISDLANPCLYLGQDKFVRQELEVFPNPANEWLQVKGARTQAPYAIYSIAGQLLSEGSITPENQRIPVNHLPDGMYLLLVDEVQAQRFIIRR